MDGDRQMREEQWKWILLSFIYLQGKRGRVNRPLSVPPFSPFLKKRDKSTPVTAPYVQGSDCLLR